MSSLELISGTKVAQFDKENFDQDEWTLANWRDQKTRHIALHIAKIPLKIVQGDEQRIKTEVMPDMALYRTQLIQTHQLYNDGLLLELCFPQYIHGWQPVLEKEIKSSGVNSFAFKRVALADGFLADYLEPSEHNEYVEDSRRKLMVLNAAESLHLGAVALSEVFKCD